MSRNFLNQAMDWLSMSLMYKFMNAFQACMHSFHRTSYEISGTRLWCSVCAIVQRPEHLNPVNWYENQAKLSKVRSQFIITVLWNFQNCWYFCPRCFHYK